MMFTNQIYIKKMRAENQIQMTKDILLGGDELVLIAGPCAIESVEIALQVAETLREVAKGFGISYVYKSSFDKAVPDAG